MEKKSIDFDILCKNVYHTGKEPKIEDQNKLWKSLYELNEWLFIVTKENPAQPMIASMDDKNWFFAFTDSEKLQKFAIENKLADSKDGVFFLSIPTNGIIDYLEKNSHLIEGVRFNQGEFGWFAPVNNFRAIYDFIYK